MTHQPYSRRAFLRMAALGSAAAVVASCGPGTGSAPAVTFDEPVSGELTRLALIRDATTLALRSPALPDTMRRALTSTWGAEGMGATFPSGASVMEFLTEVHGGGFGAWWDWSGDLVPRTAVATGYFMHRTAERRIRHALRAADMDSTAWRDARLYQDAEVIRSLLDAPPQTKEEAEALFTALDHRLRIAMHTFEPDAADVQGWVLRLLAWDDAQNAFFRALAEALATPDAEKRRRYVEAPGFIDASDPLVRAARRPRPARQAARVLEAYTASAEASVYARALDDCAQVIAQVGRFVAGDIGAEALAYDLNRDPWDAAS